MTNATKLVIGCSAAFNIGMLSWWAQPIILESVIGGFALPESRAGIVISAEIMAIALGTIFLAPRLARLSARITCLLLSALAVICHAVSMAAPPFWALLAIRLVAGASEGVVYAIAISMLARTAFPARNYAWINAANIVYCSIFMGLVPSLWHSSTKAITFLALAVGLLLMIPLLPLLPNAPAMAAKPSSHAHDRHNTRTFPLLMAMLFWGTAINTLWPFLFRIGKATPIGETQLGLFFGMSGFAAFGGVLLVALFGNRIAGHFLPLVLGFTSNVISVLLLTSNVGTPTYFLGLLLLMAAVYFLLPLLLGKGAKFDTTGRIAATLAGIYMLTGGIGPLIGGLLISFLELQVFGFLLCALMILALCLIIKAPE